MSNKHDYFSHRINALMLDADRSYLGEREIATLLTVLESENDPQGLDGKNIVDLGCGDRHLRASIEARGAVYRGIDIDECNLEIDAFPFSDDFFDIAISLSVIEHLYDPGHFLTETKRILKPGGLLWMDTPDIEACGTKFWSDPTHVHPYTRSSLRILLQMNGFDSILVAPNYRCKSRNFYRDTGINFFCARYLMPFAGTNKWPMPDFLKGKCKGLFALGRKPVPLACGFESE